MAVRVGINGFGRIGRSFYRALLARGGAAGVELVAVNDPFGDSHTMAFLLKHDSVGGTIANDVVETGERLLRRRPRDQEARVTEPAEIPWGDHGVDVVIESTGLFTSRDGAAGHLVGGAKRVIISAPSGGRRRDDLPRRQRRRLRSGRAHRHLERVVHHELPGAAGQGAPRQLRYRAGHDHDRARLHERPGPPGHCADLSQGQARPASHARRGALDHPEQHRCSTRDRAGPARAEGQARRPGHAGTHAHRVDHRPRGDARLRGHRSTTSTPRSRRRRRVRRSVASSSTPRSRWSRPTSSETRRRASSRPSTRWPAGPW